VFPFAPPGNGPQQAAAVKGCGERVSGVTYRRSVDSLCPFGGSRGVGAGAPLGEGASRGRTAGRPFRLLFLLGPARQVVFHLASGPAGGRCVVAVAGAVAGVALAGGGLRRVRRRRFDAFSSI